MKLFQREQSNEQGVMGQYVRGYQPRTNLHTLIHSFAAPRYAFHPSLVITQQKKYPDVSFYQGEIDWDKMRAQTDAVIIRAGQRNWEDPQFRRNWAEAKKRGMKRGVYWFYDDRESPGAQAELFANLIRDNLPELEITTDWENTYGGAFKGLSNVVAFMERLERLLPSAKLALYTGYYWFVANSNAIANNTQYQYLKQKPLHLAWYSDNAMLVRVPVPWTDLLLWQFGTPANGTQYGCESVEIDMNYFNGTEQEFYERYGGEVPPEEEEEMPTVNKYMRVTGSAAPSLNIRSSGANLGTENDLGNFQLYPNDIVHVVEYNPANYQRFDKIYRDNVLVELPTSPTGQYWALGSSGGTVYLMDVIYTPPVDNPENKTFIEITYDDAGDPDSIVVDGVTWVRPLL